MEPATSGTVFLPLTKGNVMLQNRTSHCGLKVSVLLGSIMFSIACSDNKKPPAFEPTPVEEKPPAPPVFEKVPPAETPAIIPAPAGSEPSTTGPYLLEVEDELDISVYGEEDLKHIVVPVRPDGMISFTFIGDVNAAGRTIEEGRAEMTTKRAH